MGVGLGGWDLGCKLTTRLVASAPIAVSGSSPTVGVKDLLEYLSAVPHRAGSLEWMSAMNAVVTASASRLG